MKDFYPQWIQGTNRTHRIVATFGSPLIILSGTVLVTLVVTGLYQLFMRRRFTHQSKRVPHRDSAKGS